MCLDFKPHVCVCDLILLLFTLDQRASLETNDAFVFECVREREKSSILPHDKALENGRSVIG